METIRIQRRQELKKPEKALRICGTLRKEKAGTARKGKEEVSGSIQVPTTKKIVILRIETIQKRSILIVPV